MAATRTDGLVTVAIERKEHARLRKLTDKQGGKIQVVATRAIAKGLDEIEKEQQPQRATTGN